MQHWACPMLAAWQRRALRTMCKGAETACTQAMGPCEWDQREWVMGQAPASEKGGTVWFLRVQLLQSVLLAQSHSPHVRNACTIPQRLHFFASWLQQAGGFIVYRLGQTAHGLGAAWELAQKGGVRQGLASPGQSLAAAWTHTCRGEKEVRGVEVTRGASHFSIQATTGTHTEVHHTQGYAKPFTSTHIHTHLCSAQSVHVHCTQHTRMHTHTKARTACPPCLLCWASGRGQTCPRSRRARSRWSGPASSCCLNWARRAQTPPPASMPPSGPWWHTHHGAEPRMGYTGALHGQHGWRRGKVVALLWPRQPGAMRATATDMGPKAHTHTHKHTYACARTHIHTHTHTHAQIHTPSAPLLTASAAASWPGPCSRWGLWVACTQVGSW